MNNIGFLLFLETPPFHHLFNKEVYKCAAVSLPDFKCFPSVSLYPVALHDCVLKLRTDPPVWQRLKTKRQDFKGEHTQRPPYEW